MESSSGSQA